LSVLELSLLVLYMIVVVLDVLMVLLFGLGDELLCMIECVFFLLRWWCMRFWFLSCLVCLVSCLFGVCVRCLSVRCFGFRRMMGVGWF